MSSAPGRAERVHAVAGVVWPLMALGGFAVSGHAAAGGARTFAAHVDGAAAGALPSLLVFTAALAVWLVTAVRARFVLGTDESLRRLRRLIALPAAAFAVTYAARVWGPVALGGSDGRALFAALTDAFSHPVPAWLLAFGAAFGALQLEQSLRVLGETFGFPRRARLALWYRGFAIVFSVVLLVFVYDGLGALIAGSPLFFGGAG